MVYFVENDRCCTIDSRVLNGILPFNFHQAQVISENVISKDQFGKFHGQTETV